MFHFSDHDPWFQCFTRLFFCYLMLMLGRFLKQNRSKLGTANLVPSERRKSSAHATHRRRFAMDPPGDTALPTITTLRPFITKQKDVLHPFVYRGKRRSRSFLGMLPRVIGDFFCAEPNLAAAAPTSHLPTQGLPWQPPGNFWSSPVFTMQAKGHML